MMRVFLAIGAQKEIEVDIQGRHLDGVLEGYEFLEDFAMERNSISGKSCSGRSGKCRY